VKHDLVSGFSHRRHDQTRHVAEPGLEALRVLRRRAAQRPIGKRATSGTRPCAPNMKRAFAAWLTISSIAHSAKSTTRISTTGLRPASAMPTAAPMAYR
jgi:hypothetical protein